MDEVQRSTPVSTAPVTSTLPSGVRTHHWPCQRPCRAIVLYQHGFGDHSKRWVEDYPFFFHDLHARHIDIWALDMWGHGESPGQRSITHVAKAVKDHIALREDLSRETEVPMILIGHSLGGFVTAESASLKSTNIQGVVLLAPALPDPMTPVARSLVRTLSRITPGREIFLKPAEVDTLSRNASFVKKWQADDRVYHGQISYLLAASALDVAAGLWPRLDQWSVPVLVVHGNMDTYTKHEQSHKFVQKVNADEKEFYLVEQGRHDLFSDTNADVTWKKVLAWIDRLLK